MFTLLKENWLISTSLQGNYLYLYICIHRAYHHACFTLAPPSLPSLSQKAKPLTFFPHRLHFLDLCLFSLKFAGDSTSTPALPFLSRLEGFLYIVCSQYSCSYTSSIRPGFSKTTQHCPPIYSYRWSVSPRSSSKGLLLNQLRPFSLPTTAHSCLLQHLSFIPTEFERSVYEERFDQLRLLLKRASFKKKKNNYGPFVKDIIFLKLH